MTLRGVPFWIGHGGAVHSPETMRLLAYVASGGAEGVINATDLPVTAQGSPNGTVAVGPGGAVLLNRSSGGASQSYVASNDASVNVTVPPTSGSARSDLLVLRVKDDQYSPWSAPGDTVNGPYVDLFLVSNVANTVKTASELSLGYTAIALARIDIPVSTTNITTAMIHDLRQIATPRTQVVTLTTNPGSVEALTSTATDGVAFPAASAAWTVDVPSWASKAVVRADWSLAAPAGNALGSLWARIGLLAGTHVDTQAVAYNTPGAAGTSRYPTFVLDTVVIPVGLRGVAGVALSLRGKLGTATPSTSRVQLDTGGAVGLQITFLETI